MDFNYNFSGNKAFRLLSIYERLNKGERIQKERLAADFGVSLKTVQRDIEDLRAYLAETHFGEGEVAIKYNRAQNAYALVRLEREWLTNEEAVALCKILLESRAFCKGELKGMVEKIIMQISPADRPTAESMIRSEYFNYVPPRHGKKLLGLIWQLSESIAAQRVIAFYYARQDGKQSKKTVRPVSVLFSEFYFYLIGFAADGPDDTPIIFRIDRMQEVKETGTGFEIPYKNRFNAGEFRKRVQFMYAGALKTVRFEYTGVLEALLDRLPTAKILKHENGVYTLSAEAYGDGIFMWLRALGNKVRLLP